MKIRSITCFTPLGEFDQRLNNLADFSQKAKQRFEQTGIEVQTTRLATSSFTQFAPVEPNAAAAWAAGLEKRAKERGFAYLSLGPASMDHPGSFDLIPTLLAGTRNVFFTGVMADAARGVDLDAVNACARVIHAAAPLEAGGFANLRFSAIANVPPYVPFLPSAYAGERGGAFSLAIESADAAVEAFEAAGTLREARAGLLARLESAAAVMTRAAEELSRDSGLEFKGLDISLAPFPEQRCSLGGALERLGLGSLGLHGSLAAAAFVADTLDRGNWKHVGFNGLMLPVLEDAVLAERAAQGTLIVKDLLTYSAVCGTGLDTVPLPGDTSAEALAALLLDVAALALRLNKPLTARLMPVPGKRAGDATNFDFAFFANSRVMALDAQPLGGLLTGSEKMDIKPRWN